jgi:hypothetical protein
MSKKIWRGHSFDTVQQCLGLVNFPDNATVVHDSAHFPVKEAMALCAASIKYHKADAFDDPALVEAACAHTASVEKYLRAVERLKRKTQ